MEYTEKLRNAVQKHIDATDSSWNKVAENADITPQTIYVFRKDGKGITYENAMKIMKSLNLTFKDLK